MTAGSDSNQELSGNALATTPSTDSAPRQSIGPYRLIRLLGSGSSGSVYAAEREVDGVMERSAIKLLEPLAAGTLLVEKFQTERARLAHLDHPAIRKILDAGIEDAQPYLSTEYVDGLPLNDYCDLNELPVRARLAIFLHICDAVDYAHRNLVVHLDLKPSNVLVTPAAKVKVLDFGTSKLIDETLSPPAAYASPEQLRGEPVTTACDIYSLGAILFELLSGQKPVADLSLKSAVTPAAAKSRGVSEARLRRILSGDLAVIVAKCLAPLPLNRYSSVAALAADIARYLTAKPVLARPRTAGYSLAKFVWRNRSLMLYGAMLTALLAGGIGYAVGRQGQAALEGERALQMQTFFDRLFPLAQANQNGKPAATVPDFLQLGFKTLPQSIRNPEDLLRAKLSLAESMYRNRDYTNSAVALAEVNDSAKRSGDTRAEVETESYLAYLGLRKGAADEAYSRSALALELARSHPLPAQTQVLSQVSYALVREQIGRSTSLDLQLIQSALYMARQNDFPPDQIGQLLYYWGAFDLTRGRLDEADQHFHEALTAYQQDPLAFCDETSAYAGLASLLTFRGKDADSLDPYKKAYEGSKTCNGEQDPQTLHFLAAWGNALVKSGKQAEAITKLEPLVPVWQQTMPKSNSSEMELLQPLGRAYAETGLYNDAEKIAQQMLDLLQQNKVRPTHKYFGYAHMLMAQALAGKGKYLAALSEAGDAYQNLSAYTQTPIGKLNSQRAERLLETIRLKMGTEQPDAKMKGNDRK